MISLCPRLVYALATEAHHRNTRLAVQMLVLDQKKVPDPDLEHALIRSRYEVVGRPCGPPDGLDGQAISSVLDRVRVWIPQVVNEHMAGRRRRQKK
jgi:hypothetical protein